MPRVLLWLALLLCGVMAQPQRYLEVREGEASCLRSRVLEVETNWPVPLPPYVSEHLNCGNVSLSPNNRWLTFVKNDQLLWWDFETRRTAAQSAARNGSLPQPREPARDRDVVSRNPGQGGRNTGDWPSALVRGRGRQPQRLG